MKKQYNYYKAQKGEHMKTLFLKNLRNQERWVCDNPRNIKIIEGVQYLTVRKPDSQRTVLIRKDILTIEKK